jgi:hypothetical protein
MLPSQTLRSNAYRKGVVTLVANPPEAWPARHSGCNESPGRDENHDRPCPPIHPLQGDHTGSIVHGVSLALSLMWRSGGPFTVVANPVFPLGPIRPDTGGVELAVLADEADVLRPILNEPHFFALGPDVMRFWARLTSLEPTTEDVPEVGLVARMKQVFRARLEVILEPRTAQ